MRHGIRPGWRFSMAPGWCIPGSASTIVETAIIQTKQPLRSLEPSMSLSPFHLAIPVYDLSAARCFYGEVFGLEEGRSSAQWVDFNFYGHQLVIHEHPRTASQESAHTNPVDGHDVPVPSSSPTSASRARWASRPPCSCSIPVAMRWNSRRSRISASCSPSRHRAGWPHGRARPGQSGHARGARALTRGRGRCQYPGHAQIPAHR